MAEHTTVRQLAHAAQQAQEWLNDLGQRPPFESPAQAYSLLRAVLHAVRDRLTAEEVAHLGAQLPMIVRGFYFEGWRPALAPNDYATEEAFFEQVASSLGGGSQPVRVDLRAGLEQVLFIGLGVALVYFTHQQAH